MPACNLKVRKNTFIFLLCTMVCCSSEVLLYIPLKEAPCSWSKPMPAALRFLFTVYIYIYIYIWLWWNVLKLLVIQSINCSINQTIYGIMFEYHAIQHDLHNRLNIIDHSIITLRRLPVVCPNPFLPVALRPAMTVLRWGKSPIEGKILQSVLELPYL